MKKFLFCIAVFCLSAIQAELAFQEPLPSQPFPTSIQKDSLLFYAYSVHSQFGEDGILEEMLNRLNIKTGFFVEFGSADGISLSNTRFLAEKGWSGAFIEASTSLFTSTCRSCKVLPKIQPIREFVTWDPSDTRGRTFDQIADAFFPNEEIDVLSIDIDGSDYLILETLKRKPKIILIEGGVYWSPYLTTRIPDEIAGKELNQPLSVIFDIADKQGYYPVCL
jgi:hypothetical protein